MAEQHFSVLITVNSGNGPYTRQDVARFIEQRMPQGMNLRVTEVHDDTVDPEDRQPGAGSAYGMEAERG